MTSPNQEVPRPPLMLAWCTTTVSSSLTRTWRSVYTCVCACPSRLPPSCYSCHSTHWVWLEMCRWWCESALDLRFRGMSSRNVLDSPMPIYNNGECHANRIWSYCEIFSRVLPSVPFASFSAVSRGYGLGMEACAVRDVSVRGHDTQ